MTARTAAEVLHVAADGFRTGSIAWGTGWFIGIGTDCRCALGGIAWAADPGNPDGDPRYVDENRPAATAAATLLAEYLVDVLDAVPAMEIGEVDGDEVRVVDPIETIGGWNDEPGRTVADVVAALDAAAERTTRTAVA